MHQEARMTIPATPLLLASSLYFDDSFTSITHCWDLGAEQYISIFVRELKPSDVN